MVFFLSPRSKRFGFVSFQKVIKICRAARSSTEKKTLGTKMVLLFFTHRCDLASSQMCQITMCNETLIIRHTHIDEIQ